MRSRFLEIPFQSFTEEELRFIIVERNRTESNAFSQDLEAFSSRLASTIMFLNRYVEEKQRFLFGGDRVQLTMREVIKWIRRKQEKVNVSWQRIGQTLLESRVPKQYYQEFLHCLQHEQALSKFVDSSIKVKIHDSLISLYDSTSSPISYSFVNNEFARESDLSSAPQSFLLSLWRIFAGVHQNEPILLIGPTSSKSHLIRTWSKLMANESNLRTITCSSSTETTDLIGSIR